MLNAVGRRIYLANEAMDMRCGIDKLSAWGESRLDADPSAGDVFVFLSRDRRRVKMLVWDVSGYWLCMKRLDRGRFARPAPQVVDGGIPTVALSAADLQLMLEGVTVHSATYRAHGRGPQPGADWRNQSDP
jgi:transposase